MSKAGEIAGNVAGSVAGAGLLGMLDGPLPFLDVVGGAVGGAIGGKIGGSIGGKKRMAGQAFQYSPLAMAGLMEGMQQANPNTQGLGLVDPNQGQDLPFAKYLVDPNPQQNPYAMY